MAKQLIKNGNNSYTFDASAGTITFSGINLEPHQLLMINNVSRETIIYNPFVSGRGFSSFANGVITLEFDTSTHDDADVLQIFYDNRDEALVSVSDLDVVFRKILSILERPLYLDPTTVAIRTTIPNTTVINSLTTVTTVNAVTSVNQVDSIPGRIAVNDPLMRKTWGELIRNRITVS